MASLLTSPPPALLAAVVLALLYTVYWHLTVGAKRRALIKQHGCLPITTYPTKDPILGLDNFRANREAFKAKRGLEAGANRFAELGVNTMFLSALGRKLIFTIEPENLKTVQALNFKHYSLGRRRKANFVPFLGLGIFTTDGAEWQHSRDMLRPNFVRSQISDLDTFESHISDLVKAIPRNGETVDLQVLFFQLTMDSATEFLFGESTNCLVASTDASNARFAEVFNRTQETVQKLGRYGPFRFLVSKKDFRSDAKFIHGMNMPRLISHPCDE